MTGASAASLAALGRQIADLGGLISLGLVLVTVFTAQVQAALDAVVGGVLQRWAERDPAPEHAVALGREVVALTVARVDLADVREARCLQAVVVVDVVECVRHLLVVGVRRRRQWRAARPAANEFRRHGRRVEHRVKWRRRRLGQRHHLPVEQHDVLLEASEDGVAAVREELADSSTVIHPRLR
jgi:hypothetical protein